MGFNHFIQIYHFPWSNDLSFYPFSCYHYMLFPLCGLDEIQCFSFSVLIPGLEVSQLDILVLLHVDGHQLQLGPTLLRLSFPVLCSDGHLSTQLQESQHYLWSFLPLLFSQLPSLVILPTSKISPVSLFCWSPVLSRDHHLAWIHALTAALASLLVFRHHSWSLPVHFLHWTVARVIF